MATRGAFLGILVLGLVLSGCRDEVRRDPAIGEAFVGPMAINIRKDLSGKAPVVGTAKHGEKLEILSNRRRFYRVRTSAGAEGWIDGRQLLTTDQMTSLQRLKDQASLLPSQGKANVYEALNVHTEPNRSSPSFAQIPEQGSIDVIGRMVSPRVPYKAALIKAPPPLPKKPKKKSKEEEKRAAYQLPLPKPPAPPEDWLKLSHSPEVEIRPASTAETNAPVIRYDDWTLIRLKDGRAGWVLSRMLTMAIPDDVAQYAEGHRITSYFSMGEVTDDGVVKHHWLWTTVSSGLQPHDFDSFRVFIWNVRRHRYETAYIERNLKGYAPVLVEGKTSPKFTVIVELPSGEMMRRTYQFDVNRVRLVEKVPYQKPAASSENNVAEAAPRIMTPPTPQTEPAGFMEKVKRSIGDLKKRLLG